jgi:GNAT superfamily N-acetyltransferase
VSVRLDNGVEVVIRPIRPADKTLLAAGVTRLSEESRRRRFLAPKPRLSASELRYFTQVDGCDHFALIAVHAEQPRWVLGVGRFVRERSRPDTAEFAIAVGDPYQRRGLGRELSRRLIDAARARGIEHFTAWTLSDNVAAERLIQSMSESLSYVGRGPGTREVVVDLAA